MRVSRPLINGQLMLFDGSGEAERAYEPEHRRRAGDPDTSEAAAARVTDPASLRERQRKVLEALREHPGGMTDEELTNYCHKAYGWAKGSTARTRRSELVEAGLVERTDEKRTLASGGPGYVWRAVGRA